VNHARGDGANESRKSGVAWVLTSRYFEISMSQIRPRMLFLPRRLRFRGERVACSFRERREYLIHAVQLNE
jgi:hypothetical protein